MFNKNASKLVSMILTFVMIATTFVIPTSASVDYSNIEGTEAIAETISNTIPVISESDEFLAEYSDGSIVVAAYRVTEKGLMELSKQDYASLIMDMKATAIREQQKISTQTTKDEGQMPQRFGGVPVSWYTQSGSTPNYPRTSLRERISNYVLNNTSNNATLSISGSKTQGATCNVSLSAGDKSTIQVQTGISYSTSYSISQTVSASISPGYTGWMEFYPIMYNSWGDITYAITTDISPFYVVTSTKWVDVYYPKQLSNGILDGVIEVKQALR